MLWWKLNFSPAFNFLAVHEFTVEVIIPKIVNIVKNDMKPSGMAYSDDVEKGLYSNQSYQIDYRYDCSSIWAFD